MPMSRGLAERQVSAALGRTEGALIAPLEGPGDHLCKSSSVRARGTRQWDIGWAGVGVRFHAHRWDDSAESLQNGHSPADACVGSRHMPRPESVSALLPASGVTERARAECPAADHPRRPATGVPGRPGRRPLFSAAAPARLTVPGGCCGGGAPVRSAPGRRT